jgi:hypothetical protein
MGAVGLAELAPALRKVEARLGRDVNVTSYPAQEFRQKIAAKDDSLIEILRCPKELLKGTPASGRSREPARREPSTRLHALDRDDRRLDSHLGAESQALSVDVGR